MIPLLSLLAWLLAWPPDLRAAAASAAPATSRASLAIGSLPRSEVPAGCGCSFFAPGGSGAAAAPLLRVNADGSAAMRLDGSPVKLRKTGEKVIQRDKKHPTAGDKLLVTLRGEHEQASVNAALARSCRVSDGCRQLAYKAVISVSRDGARQSINADGVCGC